MSYWLLIIPSLIVVASLIHMAISGQPRPRGRFFEIWILHGIFWGFGVGAIFFAYSMSVEPLASRIARAEGWSPYNPFQQLAASGILSVGLLGLLSPWLRGSFWLATVCLGLLTGWSETAVFAVGDSPASTLWASVAYNIVASSLMITLLIVYRIRAGYERFWAPTLAVQARSTGGWSPQQLR